MPPSRRKLTGYWTVFFVVLFILAAANEARAADSVCYSQALSGTDNLISAVGEKGTLDLSDECNGRLSRIAIYAREGSCTGDKEIYADAYGDSPDAGYSNVSVLSAGMSIHYLAWAESVAPDFDSITGFNFGWNCASGFPLIQTETDVIEENQLEDVSYIGPWISVYEYPYEIGTVAAGSYVQDGISGINFILTDGWPTVAPVAANMPNFGFFIPTTAYDDVDSCDLEITKEGSTYYSYSTTISYEYDDAGHVGCFVSWADIDVGTSSETFFEYGLGDYQYEAVVDFGGSFDTANGTFSIGTSAFYVPMDFECDSGSWTERVSCYGFSFLAGLIVPPPGFLDTIINTINSGGYWPISMFTEVYEETVERIEDSEGSCDLPTGDLKFTDVGTFSFDICEYDDFAKDVFATSYSQKGLYLVFSLIILFMVSAFLGLLEF